MEARRGLVENVEEVGEVAVELARRLQALALPPGEGGHGPLQGEIADADLVQAFKDAEGLPQDGFGLGRVQFPQGGDEVVDLHRAELSEVAAGQPRGEGPGVQPRAAALGAGAIDEIALVGVLVLLPLLGLGLRGPEPFETAGQAFPVLEVGPRPMALIHRQGLGMEEEAKLLLREIAQLLVGIEEVDAEDFPPEEAPDSAFGMVDGALPEA